jgi:transcription antitermination factor NusG
MIGEAFCSPERNVQTFTKLLLMEPTRHWYAVYTHAKWEKKVADLLTRKKIENYCPLNRVVRQWSDRKKIVEQPLFTCYVFVRLSDKERIPVLQTEGVLNYVSWMGKPAVIRDPEIELIKNFLSDHINVRLEKMEVDINDTIRVKYGIFIEQEGKVIEVLDKTVKVLLPSLGYVMVAELPKTHVEIVKNKR